MSTVTEEKGVRDISKIGSKMQMVAAACEWLVAFFIILYMLTFAQEFKQLRMTRSRVTKHPSLQMVPKKLPPGLHPDCELKEMEKQSDSLVTEANSES